MAVVRKDPAADVTMDADVIMDVDVEMTADVDWLTGEMAPADAAFSGSLSFFAHVAETASAAATAAIVEMATAAGSSLFFCFSAAA